MQKGLITGIVFAVLMVVLALQNTAEAPVKLFFWSFQQVPVYLIMGAAFLFGIALNATFAYIDKYRMKQANRNLRNRIRQLEENETSPEDGKPLTDNDEDDQLLDGEPGFSFFDNRKPQ